MGSHSTQAATGRPEGAGDRARGRPRGHGPGCRDASRAVVGFGAARSVYRTAGVYCCAGNTGKDGWQDVTDCRAGRLSESVVPCGPNLDTPVTGAQAWGAS